MDKTTNVLFVMPEMTMGGSERLVHSLIKKIDPDRFNPSVAWFCGDAVSEEFGGLGIPLYRVPKTKRVDVRAMRALARIIGEKKIDVVNAHHFMPFVYSFYGAKIANRARLFYTEHSVWELDKVPWKWRIPASFMLARSDGAIGVSAAVTVRIRGMFRVKDSKSFTIANGIDPDIFAGEGGTPSLRRELGIKENEKVIGMVANFRKIKNHLFLLKAFDELARDRQDMKLLLVGQGFEGDEENSEPEIRNFIEGKRLGGRVLLAGHRTDVPALLNLMDVFCLTSYKEGLPISMIEAMAAGLPVVASDAEGIRDVAGGGNGLLVKSGDVQVLKNALGMLLEDDRLRETLGLKARATAINKYSLNECAGRYERLFRPAADAGRAVNTG